MINFDVLLCSLKIFSWFSHCLQKNWKIWLQVFAVFLIGCCWCRYPHDKFDRYWFPQNVGNRYVSTTTTLTNLSTSHVVDTWGTNEFVPSVVLQTCLTVSTLGNMTISSNYFINQNDRAYVAFHWAELDPKVNAFSRQIRIQVPDNTDNYKDVFNATGGLYMYSYWLYWDIPLTTTSTSTLEIVLYPTPQSIFGPSLNALEIYGETNYTISLTTTNLDGEYSTSLKPILMSVLE